MWGQGNQGWGNQQSGWGGQGHDGHHGHHNQGFGNQGYGYGNQGGFIQPQQQGFINLGGGGGFNRWGSSGFQHMNGYVAVDYSGGWNANYHDQLLRNNIDVVYQRYDRNFSGQLEGQEFFYAYRDLCLMMGLCPPSDYHSVWNAAMQSDTNRDGRTSKL